MRSLFAALLIIGIFAGCHQDDQTPLVEEVVQAPAFDKTLRQFTRPPTIPRMNHERNFIAVYFDFGKLYDSAAIAEFHGVQDAYMFHLMQYADAHPQYIFVSDGVSLDSNGKEAGRYTYWRRATETTTSSKRAGKIATVVSN